MSDTPNIEAGSLIADRYRTEEIIGQGGMGHVYAAVDTRLERPVALKVIAADAVQMGVARSRFMREARVAAAFRHHGVAQVYDFGEHEGSLFIAMERLLGSSLAEVLDSSEGRMPLDQIVSITTAVAEVLDAASEQSLVHRDIKPENIFIESEGGRVRLLDFGLAFFNEQHDHTGRVTRDGQVLGTPLYMSPEQARGRVDVSPATDIYGLGCVLFELATGVPPFVGEVGVVLSKHMFTATPALGAVSDIAYPNRLQRLIWDMTDKNPERRPTAAEVAKALQRIAPGGSERLGKGRYGSEALGRLARMVSLPPTREEAASTIRPGQAIERSAHRTSHTIGVLGALEDDVQTALATSGVRAIDLASLDPTQEVGEVEAIIVVDGDDGLISALASDGVPVLAVAGLDDFARITHMLEAGVAEVLLSPLQPARVSTQVERVLRTGAARRRSSSDEEP